MIYRVRHKTTYGYEDPVTFARCALRLTPRSSAGQTVLETSVIVTPTPSRTTARHGMFGEEVVTVLLDVPHEELTIDARARVDVHAVPVGPLSDSPAWERVRADVLQTSDLSFEGPAAFLYPTPRTPLVAEITEYARVSFQSGRPVMAAAADLMGRIKADFVYDPKATDVATPAREAFEVRRGVCQDFAHVMICGLKGLGLPAAYVSGYLRTLPPPGKPRLQGADATHAWVQLWCGQDLGWVGFDPTNALLVQNDHIVLAVGRDYSDVAPISGIILSPGEQTIKVEVDVVPETELAAPAEQLAPAAP